MKILRKMSIRRRLAYAFLILCFIPISAMIIISTVFEFHYFNNNLKNNYENFAYESNIRVNDLFEQLELKFNYLKENNDILADLYLYNTRPKYQTKEVALRIENTIASIMSTQNEIIYTAVYFEDGDRFSYSHNPIENEQVDDLLREEAGWHFSTYGGEPVLLRKEEIEIDYNNGTYVTFEAVISLDEIEILLIDALGSVKQRIAITDSRDQIVSGKKFDREQLVHEVTVPIPDTNLNIKNTFQKESYDLKGLYTTMFLFSFVLLMAGIVLYLVNESIKIPLTRLLDRITQINNNEAILVDEEVDDMELTDEHEILNREFNAMLIRLNELLEESYISKIQETELRTRIKELELVALQQRINPHFLYNLLDNIFWMAQMRGFEEIGEMVSALGEFFKTSVSEKGVFVTINTEIDNVKSYVYLQKRMHKNQFIDEWQIDPEIINYKTVKLILQPIIENCIVHGFEGVEEGGVIRIIGKKENDNIVFEISDNGKGMTAETCEGISMKMNSTILGVGDSIGMRNVNQRIKIYYGESFGIDIKSKLNEGTTVNLRIPIGQTNYENTCLEDENEKSIL